MKVAVAGRYPERERIRAKLALEGLPTEDMTVTADWLVLSYRDDGDVTHRQAQAQVMTNHDEIAACDVLVFLPSWTPSAGRFVDLGMALAFRKPVIVLGEPNEELFRLSIYLRPGVVQWCQEDCLVQTIQRMNENHSRRGGYSGEEQQ